MHTTHSKVTAANLVLKNHRDPGHHITVVNRPRYRELHISHYPLENESVASCIARLSRSLGEQGARVVRHEVFSDLALQAELQSILSQQLGKIAWPITWTEGSGCCGHRLAGMHLTAISGIEPEIVEYQGRIVGTLFQDGPTRHCYLGALQPDRLSDSRSDQALRTLEMLEAMLELAGMKLSNLARTWFFLDSILDWYGEFNAVRTSFFKSRQLLNGLVPASTGVGARNPHGCAVQAAALAIQRPTGPWSIREVHSPLQCSASDYGSSFSRAVELVSPEFRQLVISGTASIAPGGASVSVGDMPGQIDLTMRVVQAILTSCGMSFADASRVTAYFKSPPDVRFFDAWRSGHGLQEWPVVCAQADICRRELLFEIEMDALAPAPFAP